jgi:hypothetical protein
VSSSSSEPEISFISSSETQSEPVIISSEPEGEVLVKTSLVKEN